MSVGSRHGSRFYSLFIAQAQRLELTEVALDVAGDARFPIVDPAQWREVRREPQVRGPGDEADYGFVALDRR